MLVAGGLAANGTLDPLAVIGGCVAGAALGDAISYLVGARVGRRVFRHRTLRPHRRRIAHTRLLCRRYGAASIYIGRFFGPLRAFIPAVLGMLRMRQRTLQLANVASAVVWVIAMLAPGYLAAKGLAELEVLLDADLVTLAVIGLGVAAVSLIAVCGWVRRSRAKRDVMRRALVRRRPQAEPCGG